MSRGIKKKNHDGVLDWQQLFNKNIGKYLQIISIELSKRSHSSSSSSEELLEVIEKEKEVLLLQRKLKPNKATARFEILKLRYEIPKNWNWFLLSDVAFYQEGPGIRSFQYRDEGIKLLNVENITPNKLRLDLTSRFISKEEFELKYKHFKIEDGDILFASSGGSWGKVCWFEDPGFDVVLNTSTMRIKSFSDKVLLNVYLFLFLKTDFFRNQLVPQLMGMQPNFGSTHFNSVSIPVPPVEQQKKILKFLNDLENQSLKVGHEYFNYDVERIIINLHKTQLKGSDLAFEFKNQSDYLQLLRQTILQEAVQGKLTKQDPTDEPATALLKRIKAEKEKLIKAGKLKKEHPPIIEDEILFELPEGWVWCRLGEICTKIGSGSTPRGGKEVYKREGIKFIRSQNVYNEGLVFDSIAYIDEATHKKMGGTKVIANDILLNITGGSIGRCALVPEIFDEANVSQHVTIVRTVSLVVKEFIHQLMISPYFQDNIMATQTGGNREGLAKKNMELMLIPFPPLAEQQRIVAKVQQLQQQLTRLEAQVQQSRQYAQQLLQAVLKEAFQPAKEYAMNEQITMAAES